MTLNAPYDADNIFTKIISGDIPSVKVSETDETLAFMDVFPQSDGHVLVIHKTAPAANILQIDGPALASVMNEVQRITKALTEALEPDGIRIVQFNGAPAGQTVFHLHFHMIPVYEGVNERPHGSGGPLDAEILDPIAAKIRAAL